MNNLNETKNNRNIIILFLVMVISASAFQSNAQDILRLKDKLTEESGNAVYFRSLLTNSLPYIILEGDELTTHGNGSYIILNANTESYSSLYKANELFNEIELIKLQINSISDLNASLDLGNLKSFENLNYIIVSFTFDVCNQQSDNCLEGYIKDIILNIEDNPVLVLYELSIPN